MSIIIDHVTRRFGSTAAIANLSLEIREGELLSVLGANGAGKTTLVHLLSGLITQDEGHVRVFGCDLPKDWMAVKTMVGLCPQECVVWNSLTCTEQLLYMARLYDLPRREAETRAATLLSLAGLTDKSSSRPPELSGGMRRLLNVLLSIVHDPRLVILDEPFTELDPYNRKLIRSTILDMVRRQGRTVIVTSNDTHEIDAISDRIAIIDRGELLAVEAPQTLKNASGVAGANLEDAFTSMLDARRSR